MIWVVKTQPLAVGDTVAGHRTFFQNIACYIGDLPRARGKVITLIFVCQDVTLAEEDS
jgi:hypothetical protein